MTTTTTTATTATTTTTTTETEATGTTSPSPTAKLTGLAAGVGPLLLTASTVAWLAGDQQAELRAILMAWAFPIAALGVAGVAARLERPSPRGRAIVTALLAIGGAAGAGFGVEAAMVEHFGVDRLMGQATPSGFLALGLPGLCFPIGVAAVGALSFWHGTLPHRQAALLGLAGALFPLSRIPQVPALALVADVALLAALAPVAVSAWRTLRAPRRRLRAAAPQPAS